MTKSGIQLHLLTQETENDSALGGIDSTIRRLYYRELIARFAHHPVLQWNIGEENRNTDAEKLAFAQYIRELDPYSHPIVVHTYYDLRENFSSGPETYYDGILGSPYYDASSMQGNGSNYNRWAIEYRSRSRDAGHSWVIYGDEQGPPVNKNMNNIDQLRKETLWGNLMGGGGGVEWYFGYQDEFGDLQSEDWRVAQPLWEDTAHALHFFQTYLPFWEMEPNNDLVSNNDAFALTKTDAIYVLYAPSGSPGQVDLGTTDKTFNVWWYDPRNGGELQAGTIDEIVGPGWEAVGEPPSANNQDWVVLVQATDVTIPDPDDMTVIRITENELHNAMQDNIVSNPLITDLAFVLPDFTPGNINLTVRLNDGAVAAVTVSVNNTGGIAILQLSAPTINGQIAPMPVVQSINRELPLLITSALDHWIARAGAGDTKLETIAINEQFIVIETLR
jgi:hypothetical protein